MTLRQLVERAKAEGLQQCREVLWRGGNGKMLPVCYDNITRVKQCCILGLVRWGEVKEILTEEEAGEISRQLLQKCFPLKVSVMNDEYGASFEKFVELIEQS